MRSFLLCCLLLISGLAFGQRTISEKSASVYFATASSELGPEARRAIDAFRQELGAYADFSIRLEAFTDQRGNDAYNEELAEKRATAVKTYLEATSIATTGWEVTSWGERRARSGDLTEAELQTDRRVDLVATVTPWQDLQAVLSTLREGQVQTFMLLANKPNTVVGDRGGRFLIEANSFENERGEPAVGNVVLSLTEAYTFDDILLAGLTTHSGDRLLETGGMFRLNATDEAGNPLSLVDGKSIAGSIPTMDFNEEMRLFAGVEDEEGRLVDWSLTSGRVVATPAQLATRNLYAGAPLCWSYSLENYLEDWEAKNPEPKLAKARKIPAVRTVPVMPDTSEVVWKPSGLNGLFTSRLKRRIMTNYKKQRVMAEYKRKVKARERAIRIGEENIAFNLGREDRYDAALTEWYDKREAEKMRLSEEYDLRNAALRKDYEMRKEAWMAKRKASLETALNPDERVSLDRYFFSVNSLGWANCDIFWDNDDPVEVLAQVSDSDIKTTMILIPEGRRSVLTYRPRISGLWACSGIPRNEAYKLIGYQVREGKIEFAQRQVAAAGETPEILDFQPVSVGELKELMKTVVASK